MATAKRFSVTSWRTIRGRVAPSAERSDSSCARCVRRAKVRLLTLTHAMRSTSPAVATNSNSVGRSSRRISSSSGSALAM
jgi:hypothetical protein